MAETVVFINDRRVDHREAAVSVFDYTLHCGIGLFESILAVDDRLILLDEHLNRMEKSISRLGLHHLRYDRQKVKATLRRAARMHSAKIKKTKILLTHGGSPLWPGSHPRPKTIVMVVGHRLEFRPQKLMISPMVIAPENPLRGLKTLNYMTEWLSQKIALEAGYDQGIIVNQRGLVAETGSANIFMTKNGRLFTPPLSSGGLPGVMRAEVFQLAAANGIACRERKITPDDLAAADEIFISSSFKLIWPVVELRLDANRRYLYRPGPVATLLFDQMKTAYLSRGKKT